MEHRHLRRNEHPMKPHIIRSIAALDKLDRDTLLVSDDETIMKAQDWREDFCIDPTGIFPLAVIATSHDLRASLNALDEETRP